MATIQLTGEELEMKLAKRIQGVKDDIASIDAELALISHMVRPKGFRAWLFWSPPDTSFLHFRKVSRQNRLEELNHLWRVANRNRNKLFNVNTRDI